MSSPFPGMDPYLENEEVWHDFHERFIPALAEALGPQVRPNYIVKIDEHAYIHELPSDQRRLIGRPDLLVSGSSTPAKTAGATAEAPIYGQLPLAVDVERQPYIEIRDRATREIVTVVEILSPSNKCVGADRDQYLGKREQFLRSTASFVEIDLLRGNPRLPVEGLPPCDYYAMVSRPEDRPRVELWPMNLRDPLKPVPIPLRAGDADATLDLQQVLGRVHDAACYQDYIYQNAPQPPLSADDARWVARLAAEAIRMSQRA